MASYSQETASYIQEIFIDNMLYLTSLKNNLKKIKKVNIYKKNDYFYSMKLFLQMQEFFFN